MFGAHRTAPGRPDRRLRASPVRAAGRNGAQFGSSARWVLTGNGRRLWAPRSARWTALADELGEGARTRTAGALVGFLGSAEEPTKRTMLGFGRSSSTAGNPRGRFPA